MRQSHLLNSVVNGKWMMLPRYAGAQRDVVEKLLDRSFASKEYDSLLSERVALTVNANGTHKMAIGSDGGSVYDQCTEGTIVIFSIIGSMLKYGTWCSYGMTEIADAMKEAAAHPNVAGCVIDGDSGGGAVDAIPPMLEAIKAFQDNGKPVVMCADLCASAFYFVACQCDYVMAANDLSSEFGSIGVMMSFRDYSQYYKANGIEDHVVYSTLSDWKNLPIMNALNGLPDAETRYDLLKSEELDPLAKQFQDTVTSCRKKLDTTSEGVLSGRMFFAADALRVGLIDEIGSLDMAIEKCKQLSENKQLIYNYLK